MSSEPGQSPVDSTRQWFPFHAESPEAEVRLFCVPHAGAGASAYLPWARTLPHHIEVCGVELAGRGTRAAEPPLRRVSTLVAGLGPAIRPLLDRPYVLHGHGMGALLAFETARALREVAAPPPAALVVSGMVGPAHRSDRPPVHQLDTPELVARAEELFGLAPAMTADEDVLALLLPVLRADLEVAETYRCVPGPPLACPVTVLAGAHDQAARPVEVREWRAVTTGDFSLRVFDGGHSFLHECPEVVDEVAALCARFLARPLSAMD